MERDKYVAEFTWDDTKFPRTRSLIDIATNIQERVRSVDIDIKTYIDEYSESNSMLQALQKSKGTSFTTTDLSEVIYGKVDKKLFVSEESQFLDNMLVVVPGRKEKDFLDSYFNEEEALKNNDVGIVPGSAKYLELEDEEKNRIYRVIFFHKFPDA